MEVGEQCPLLSNAIEMRGVVVGAVRANALRTNIINKYYHNDYCFKYIIFILLTK